MPSSAVRDRRNDRRADDAGGRQRDSRCDSRVALAHARIQAHARELDHGRCNGAAGCSGWN